MNLLERLFVGLLVTLFVGCNNINNNTIKDFVYYQVDRRLESIGKNQIKEEFRNNPSLSFDDYENQRLQISSISSKFHKSEMFSIGNLFIDTKGHVKIKIEGEKENNKYNYGLFRTTKNNPVKLHSSINNNKIKIGADIEDYKVYFLSDRRGDFELMFQWSLRF